ncbi:hypothetical protein L917_02536, partial [Phytophthora nicotianae]
LKPFESVSTLLGAQVYPTLSLVMSGIDAIEAVIKNKHIFDSKLNAAGSEGYVDEVRAWMIECQKKVSSFTYSGSGSTNRNVLLLTGSPIWTPV